MDLGGKSAIVTGGAVRIGRALSIALAREGVNVCIHYGSSIAAAEKTASEIESCGVRATVIQADLRKSAEAARRVVEHAAEKFGAVDFLINSAAVFEAATLADTTEESYDRHLAINLKAPLFLCREFAAQLSSNRNGHIINIADWRGTHPVPGHLAYTLTKSAIVTLTQILAVELAPGVQVNAIAPGAILPPPGKDDAYLDRIAAKIPLKRSGSPDDMTAAAVFLLRSEFITGEIMHVTGGEHL
ncbi:MAG: SDR family oxidoreductase [Planctomycetaceae bacterium]